MPVGHNVYLGLFLIILVFLILLDRWMYKLWLRCHTYSAESPSCWEDSIRFGQSSAADAIPRAEWRSSTRKISLSVCEQYLERIRGVWGGLADPWPQCSWPRKVFNLPTHGILPPSPPGTPFSWLDHIRSGEESTIIRTHERIWISRNPQGRPPADARVCGRRFWGGKRKLVYSQKLCVLIPFPFVQ